MSKENNLPDKDNYSIVAHNVATNFFKSPDALLTKVLGRGEVNAVYYAELHGEKIVVRVNKPEELQRFEKEKWCADNAVMQGVSTPSIIDIGINADCAFMIQQYAEGSNGIDINPTVQTWKELGTVLRKIHGVITDSFGDSTTDLASGNLDKWQKYLDDNIKALQNDSRLISSDLLNDTRILQLKVSFESLRYKEFRFGLSHGDFSLANTIYDTSPVIIDWGCAQAQVVPHYDLGIILDESLDMNSPHFAALLSGYGMTMQEFEQIHHDIRSIRLLEAVDKLRWAYDKAPEQVDNYTTKLTHLLG